MTDGPNDHRLSVYSCETVRVEPWPRQDTDTRELRNVTISQAIDRITAAPVTRRNLSIRLSVVIMTHLTLLLEATGRYSIAYH